MAFRAGNRARKKESEQDTVERIDPPSIDEVIEEFHHVVGEYTHDIRQSIRDRVNAAVLLYIVEACKENNNSYRGTPYWDTFVDMTEKLTNNDILNATKNKNNNSYGGTPYWNTLVDKIKDMENINESILPLLKHKPNYCFNPIIRKIFAGDITDFVAYPYPVNCGLKLNPDEKELLIEINNFKCSFMEETMGNLYLSTKIILSNEEIPEGIFDWLGYYTKHIFTNPDQVEPEVWLLINKIEAESISLGCDRKYILAKVYIHEMMHRYYDMHPELLMKRSVKEIEEPMANFATLKFCEEFYKAHEDKEHKKLLDVAIKQIKGLKDTDNYFYALGADLYELNKEEEKRHSLIDIYRHVCMMFHEQNKEVIAYLNLVRDSENINKYQEGDEGVKKQFCEALINC